MLASSSSSSSLLLLLLLLLLLAVVAVVVSAEYDNRLSVQRSPPQSAACIGVIAGSNPLLLRWPYITAVGPTSATLLFGTDQSVRDAWVVYSDAAGNHTAVAAFTVTAGLNLFVAHLENLTPKSEVCYNVYSSSSELVGGYSFTTAPLPTDGSLDAVTFTALGDFGFGGAAANRVRDAMWSRYDQSDMLIGLGDNVYFTGTPAEYQNKLFDVYREQLLSKPLYLTYGNHDFYHDGAATYLQNFPQFSNILNPSDTGRYFSFDFGFVHFLSICTEIALDESAEHPTDGLIAWLEDDLAANTNATWTIALLHKVPYDAGQVVDNRVADWVVPLLERYGVQLLVGGHWHTYERYPPMINELPVAMADGGMLNVVTGGGGFPVVGDIIPMCGASRCAEQFSDRATGYVYDPAAEAARPPVGARRVPAPERKINEHHFIYVTLTRCEMEMEVINQYGSTIDNATYSIC